MAPEYYYDRTDDHTLVIRASSAPSAFVSFYYPVTSNDRAYSYGGGGYALPPAPGWSEIQRRYWEFVHGPGPFPSALLGPSSSGGRRAGWALRSAPPRSEARKRPGPADRAHRRAVRRLLKNT